jgi:hypothetical protein
VVLTPPLAGAEFSLPERGELRLGRAPELDVALDHRSVSREHAKIACDGGQARIIDLGSVNGVVIKGEKVSEARLVSGDVIELGDVLLRYVGPGEHYMFDPAEVRALTASKHERSRAPQLVALGLVVGGIIAALAIVHSGQKSAVSDSSAPVAVVAVASGSPAAVTAPEPDHFAELLDACRKADEGGRYAEAVAHASAALKAHPDAAEALACQQIARANNEQEQIYVRGKAALQSRDAEGAWKELSSLSAGGAVRRRPEVEAALVAAAQLRLGQAEALLRRRSKQAGELASSVLSVERMPEAIRAQAQAVVDRATGTRPGKAARPEAAQRAAGAEPRPKSISVGRAVPAARSSPGDKSSMDSANACLARGDNACVVRTLNGKAQTAQELGLLIETYRAMGDSTQALRNMVIYVQRFATAPRADAYRRMIERQGK